MKRRDHMESFWLSESLKYLWLLFSDDGADLPLPAIQNLLSWKRVLLLLRKGPVASPRAVVVT